MDIELTTPPEPERVGYRKPPTGSRFVKGQSGNPRGRPRGRKNFEAPYEAVLGQRVKVRSDGLERVITAAEAFLLQMTRKGLAGDAAAARTMLDAIEAAPLVNSVNSKPDIAAILIRFRGVDRGDRVLDVICRFGMARKVDAYRDTARVKLEVWVVEMALAKLGDRMLNPVEQKTVWTGCRTPWKVRWPQWWTYNG